MSLGFLWSFGRVRRWFPDEGRNPSHPSSLVVGAISGVSIQYVSERDPTAPKLERNRYRLLHSLGIQAWNRVLYWFVSAEDAATIGSLVGVVLYRLVFGVLLPVPEGRLRWSWPLDRWCRSDGSSSN